MIEQARSGRASCRLCRKPIAKDTWRFGDVFGSAFYDGDQVYWYHLECGAKKRPEALREELKTWTGGAIPGRAAIEASLDGNEQDARLKDILRLELSPSGQATCMECRKPIGKSTMRLAILNQDDVEMLSTSFAHIGCAAKYTKNHPDTSKKLDELSASIPNAKCPACSSPSNLSYLDPSKHKMPEGQLSCGKCGGMFELTAIDSRKKSKPKKTAAKKKTATPKPKAKAKTTSKPKPKPKPKK